MEQPINKKSVGRIRHVRGQIVTVACEHEYRPVLRELLRGEGPEPILLEAHSYEDRDTLNCLLLSHREVIARNTKVYADGRELSVPVGEGVLGHAIDLYGHPADGGKFVETKESRSIYGTDNASRGAAKRRERKIVETGIKAIDFFTPVPHGGIVGLVGGAGVGKTILMTEIMRNLGKGHQGVAIFAGIGERIREGHELRESLRQTGMLDRTALVVGYINENAAVRFRIAWTAATLAEYFRDEEKKDVLFFVDNIFRFVQAGSELSTLMGEIPSEFGYQSTLQSEIAAFENRLISREEAAVTSVQAVYVPADELTNPAVAATLPYLDSTVVLSRDASQQGHYPAIDFLRSKSSVLDPSITGEKHYTTLTAAIELLNQYDRLERIVTIIGEGELSARDRTLYQRAGRLLNYMTQPFFTIEEHSGRPGVFVHRETTIADVEAILSGKFDIVPPEQFLYIGGTDELTLGTSSHGKTTQQAKKAPAPAASGNH